MGGYRVYSLDEAINIDFDEIWIVNSYFETLIMCLTRGICKNKLVIGAVKVYEEYCLYFDNDIKYLKDSANCCSEYIMSANSTIMTTTMPKHHNTMYTKVIFNGKNEYLYNKDYVRYATLLLLSEEIENNKIVGSVAELGVYRGEFAGAINTIFKNRKLFLFDTFDGFDSEDVNIELEKEYISEKKKEFEKFENTTIDMVMAKMPYPENCVIRKGKFPNTINKEDGGFAFVSIDCDLYTPALEGLRYFYPRLASGGYIMLHDYSNAFFAGIRKALSIYEEEVGHIAKTPIPDAGGTIIITK